MRAAAAALLLLASACAAAPQPAIAPPPPVIAAPAPAPAATLALPPKADEAPPGMQWLYGSAEGAATSVQTYRAFAAHAVALAPKRGRMRDSVVLARGKFAEGTFFPCGRKPLAVMLDVDETAIQNLGYEYGLARRGRSADSVLLKRWQEGARTEVKAMPGAVDALHSIRAAGITVIFNSNRDVSDAAATAATLNNAGLGPAEPGKTLLLRGDADGKSGKDGRRSQVAEHFCVVAMAGDQLGDFADGFNDRALGVQQRRALAEKAPFASLWGNGWFLLSNPVYGPGLRGSIEDVFPPDMRWGDEGVK